MASLPQTIPLRPQFSLRGVFLTTALVALFFALRRGYLMTAFNLRETIERATNVPTILSLAAALVAALFLPSQGQGRASPGWRGAILGSTVGALSCLALVIEFGEAARRISPEYWNWLQDWPEVFPYFVVATVQGGAIGAFVLQAASALRSRRSTQRQLLVPPVPPSSVL